MNCTFCMHFPVWFIGCLSCSFDLHIRTLFSTRSFAGRYTDNVSMCVCVGVRIRAQRAYTHTVCVKKTIGKMHLTYSCEKWSGSCLHTMIRNACRKIHPQTILWTDLKRTFKTEMRATNALNVRRERASLDFFVVHFYLWSFIRRAYCTLMIWCEIRRAFMCVLLWGTLSDDMFINAFACRNALAHFSSFKPTFFSA